MTSFRLLKPGITSTFITLFMTLQLVACNTEDFAEAVAGNIIPESSSSLATSNNYETDADNIISETSSSSEPSNISEADADIIITDTTSSSEPSTSSETGYEPATKPATTPTPASTTTPAIAMYSYNKNLSDAQALSGAVLEQTTVHLFFSNSAQYSSMRFYCCKGISGENNREGHNEPSRDSSAPFIYSVDLSQYGTTGTRELYVDATHADGSGYDSLNANFSINITSIPVVPEPAVADVNLSWVAPVQREDNKTISPAEIAGYKIYYGTTAGNYTKSVYVDSAGGSVDSHTLQDIPVGTYYFVITTRDTGGRESKYSPEVTIITS